MNGPVIYIILLAGFALVIASILWFALDLRRAKKMLLKTGDETGELKSLITDAEMIVSELNNFSRNLIKNADIKDAGDGVYLEKLEKALDTVEASHMLERGGGAGRPVETIEKTAPAAAGAPNSADETKPAGDTEATGLMNTAEATEAAELAGSAGAAGLTGSAGAAGAAGSAGAVGSSGAADLNDRNRAPDRPAGRKYSRKKVRRYIDGRVRYQAQAHEPADEYTYGGAREEYGSADGCGAADGYGGAGGISGAYGYDSADGYNGADGISGAYGYDGAEGFGDGYSANGANGYDAADGYGAAVNYDNSGDVNNDGNFYDESGRLYYGDGGSYNDSGLTHNGGAGSYNDPGRPYGGDAGSYHDSVRPYSGDAGSYNTVGRSYDDVGNGFELVGAPGTPLISVHGDDRLSGRGSGPNVRRAGHNVRRNQGMSRNRKYLEVIRRYEEGMSEAEIARTLNIGRGEVALILGLREDYPTDM